MDILINFFLFHAQNISHLFCNQKRHLNKNRLNFNKTFETNHNIFINLNNLNFKKISKLNRYNFTKNTSNKSQKRCRKRKNKKNYKKRKKPKLRTLRIFGQKVWKTKEPNQIQYLFENNKLKKNNKTNNNKKCFENRNGINQRENILSFNIVYQNITGKVKERCLENPVWINWKNKNKIDLAHLSETKLNENKLKNLDKFI